MTEILRFLIPLLVALLGTLIALVLIRELVRSVKRRAWQKKKERCRALIGQLEFVRIEEVIPLALELKKSFPVPLIDRPQNSA